MTILFHYFLITVVEPPHPHPFPYDVFTAFISQIYNIFTNSPNLFYGTVVVVVVEVVVAGAVVVVVVEVVVEVVRSF